jgi:serine phosphatase RsbU (regulator of sigma subunit)
LSEHRYRFSIPCIALLLARNIIPLLAILQSIWGISEANHAPYQDIAQLQTAIVSHVFVFLAVGDVSGHGISSALLMATVRSSLRQQASHPGSTAQIVCDVNRQPAKDVEHSGEFITMFLLVIDAEKNSIGSIPGRGEKGR